MTFLELSKILYPVMLEVSRRAVDNKPLYNIRFVKEDGRVASTKDYEFEEDAVSEVIEVLGPEYINRLLLQEE